jgi:hypothetical protein
MMEKHQMNKKFFTTLIVCVVLAGLSVSCGGKNENSPDYVTVLTVSATEDISPYFTQAAETVFAQITETAKAQPTETPTPTVTATSTPSTTPTGTATVKPAAIYVWVPSATTYTSTPITLTPSTPTTVVTASGYSCSVTSQSVANGAEFVKGSEFDASWTLKNTGTSAWDANEIDYLYISGTAMHKNAAAYDFPSSVAAGSSITITVDMIAPSSAASYETYWGVTRSSVNFCTLPLKIKVID